MALGLLTLMRGMISCGGPSQRISEIFQITASVIAAEMNAPDHIFECNMRDSRIASIFVKLENEEWCLVF